MLIIILLMKNIMIQDRENLTNKNHLILYTYYLHSHSNTLRTKPKSSTSFQNNHTSQHNHLKQKNNTTNKQKAQKQQKTQHPVSRFPVNKVKSSTSFQSNHHMITEQKQTETTTKPASTQY